MKDPELARAEMVSYYRDHDFAPITGISIEVPKNRIPIGGVLSVPVKFPDEQVVEYMLVRTTNGYRVDWLASKKNSEKAEARARPAKTPREQFLAEAVKHEWIRSSYNEIAVAGKTIRLRDLDIHADRIVRSGDRLDLFVTVTNVSAGHVFSPETHPYNDQMLFQGKFIDSFLNWSSMRLEQGTHDIKPGEHATIHYSAEVKIDAPLYMLTFSLTTGNDIHDLEFLYIIASADDFQEAAAAAGD